MVGGETVEGAAGRSLQQMSDLRDGNSWWVSQQHMHVVSGVACRENPSVKAAGALYARAGLQGSRPWRSAPASTPDAAWPRRGVRRAKRSSGYRARAERRGAHKDLSAGSRDCCVAMEQSGPVTCSSAHERHVVGASCTHPRGRSVVTLWPPRLAHCARCARGKPGHGGSRASPHPECGLPATAT